MKYTAVSACLSLMFAATTALSQEHLTPNPPCIIVQLDGSYEIRLGEGDGPAHHEAVPVYWKAADGRLRSEKTYSGVSSDGLGSHSARVPLYLLRHTDGTWTVEEGIWTVCHGPKGRWETDIPGSGRVFVRDLNAPAVPRPDPAEALKARGGINILHTYDDFGRPGYLDEAAVARAASNAVATINEILGDDYAPALVQFVWVDFSSIPGREDTLAVAKNIYESRSLNIIANSIGALYTSNDTDSFETGLQNSAPLPNVSYKSNLGDDNTTNSAWITLVQASKLFLIPQPTLVIEINSARDDLDPDPSGGIAAGHYDLTGVLVHELIHLLGFSSFTENPSLALDGPITQWDTFRLNASDLSVSAAEFSGAERELRSSQAAVGVLQLDLSSHLYRLSQGSLAAGGDDRQASHWRDNLLNDSGIYIGIMDPTIPPGVNLSTLTLSGTYFTLADIRALDVMGYDIDGSDYAPFPNITEPVLFTPIADAVLDPALDVVFSWDAGNEIEADLLVYDLGTTVGVALGEPMLVYRQDGVVGGSATVGAGEIGLEPGHRYRWNIGARYDLGFATSPPATFIAACYADRIGDGVINFFDFSDFLADYGAMHPSADLAAPFGVWNFFDLSAYQTLYNAGCP